MVKRIAGEVRRYRLARGMSTQQLADACSDLGLPIKRTVLSNLESGYRETITVPELLVLARALGVPPIRLLFPLGAKPKLEVLPGRTVDTEAAMLWFTGWHDLFREDSGELVGQGTYDPDSGLREWYETPYWDAAYPVHAYHEHRELLQQHAEAVRDALRGLGADHTPEDLRDEVARRRRQTEMAIRIVRRQMRSRGMTVLPELPPELEHLR